MPYFKRLIHVSQLKTALPSTAENLIYSSFQKEVECPDLDQPTYASKTVFINHANTAILGHFESIPLQFYR